MTLRVEEIPVARLATSEDSICRKWDSLCASQPRGNPMVSSCWVVPYSRHILPGASDSTVCFAFSGDAVVAVFPFVERRKSWRGDIFSTPFNSHSLTGDVLLAEGFEEEALESLFGHLGRSKKSLGCLAIRGTREDSPAARSLVRCSGVTFISESRSCGDYLPIRGAFEDYRKSLSRNFRGNLRKAANKLPGSADAEFEILGGPSADAGHLEEFLALEESGWKGKHGTAILQNASLIAFYRSMATRLAERGWLYWFFLRLGGRIVAAQLACRIHATVTILKIAYDEEYSRCAPGNLLFHRLVEWAYEQGDVEEIDCITDSEWHGDWNMSRRRYSTLYIFPMRPGPLLLQYAPKRTHIALRDIAWLRYAVRQTKGLHGK